MSTGEFFNQQRMQRCADIAHKIIANWEQTNSFTYTLRATDSVEGIELSELRKRHFSIGVGDDLVDVPLNDVLVVFSLIEKHAATMKQVPKSVTSDFAVRVHVQADPPDEEAVRLLSQLRIETPFDKGQALRIAIAPQPPDSAPDGPQTQP